MKIEAKVDGDLSPLSKRENEVFGMLAEGLSQRQMSDRLYRSFATVSTHIQNIKDKLDADSSTQAVSIGVIKGFLSFKTLAVYGLICSSVFGLVLPADAVAGNGDVERVFGRGRISRVRGKSGRRKEDVAGGVFLDEV